MDKKILDVSPDKAITRTWHFNPDTEETTIQTTQDVTAVIEANKRDFAAIDNKANWKGEWHHVASIPESLYYKLKAEGKIDDPVYMKKWLNDADNRFFRVRPGQV
ncbi:MAG: hypothetical protein EBR47_03975 [Betaproteobacteria bacterium]|nr:hypothetical protein [Betaproteobacteria bacterium]